MSQKKPAMTIARAWTEIDVVLANVKGDRRKLGQLFLQVRALYSNKSADVRRLGVGTFEQEISKRRGPNGHPLSPRTVREWISDYEAHQTNAPSSSAKRKARRLEGNNGQSPLARFAIILTYKAAKAAFLTAAKELHPDHGGSEAKMKELNRSWEEAEPIYKGRE